MIRFNLGVRIQSLSKKHLCCLSVSCFCLSLPLISTGLYPSVINLSQSSARSTASLCTIHLPSTYLTSSLFPPFCHAHICLRTCWYSLYFVFSLFQCSLWQILFPILCFESDLYISKLFIFLKDVDFFLEFSCCFSSLQEPSSTSFIELLQGMRSMQNLSRTQTLRTPMEPKQTWRTSSHSCGSVLFLDCAFRRA